MEIEWQNEKDIVELITELGALLKDGYKTVTLQVYKTGDGSTEDGSYEYEYHQGKLVADY